jgi:hypothetical protein
MNMTRWGVFVGLMLVLVVLTGCDTFGQKSGIADYTLTPTTEADGSKSYEIRVRNTKDYKSLKVHIEKRADGTITVDLDERDVNASDLGTVMAETSRETMKAVGALIDRIPIVN